MENETEQLSFAEVLAELLTAEDIPFKHLKRLSDLSDADVQTVQHQWVAAEDERRHAVTRHLADISEDDFVVDFSRFFGYCLQDTYPPVRIAALDGLWDADDLKIMAAIIALLQNDESHEVRAAAAAALSHYLMMAQWGELPDAIEPLLIKVLLEAYNHPDAVLATRRAALEALGVINTEQISQLLADAYESGSYEMQLSAVFAMGNSADPRWVTIVIDEMESPYEEMRAIAARSAGEIGSSDFSGSLTDLVLDEDEDVALNAIAALGKIGDAHALEILDDFLHDPDLEELHDAIDDAVSEAQMMSLDFDLDDIFGDDWQPPH